ncbi:hypothetical protein Tco_0634338, partial [Tanacetum coccineum]
SLVDIESSGTESGKQDTSSSSGNDIDADDADIIPIYDEEPMVEVQLTDDTSSSPGNDIDVDDADIIPIYDEEPIVEVQLT